MILQLFQIFLLLCLSIYSLPLSLSIANTNWASIPFQLPFYVEANCSFLLDEWFKINYISSSGNSFFIEKIDLQVFDFSFDGAKRGYGVKYCQTAGITSPFTKINETVGSMIDEGGKLQECKYALFVDEGWFEYISLISSPFDARKVADILQLFNPRPRPRPFSFNVFPIDSKSFNRKCPVLKCYCIGKNTTDLRLEENVDDPRDQNIPFPEPMTNRNLIGCYNTPGFLSAIGASLGGLFILRSWLCIFTKEARKINFRKFFKRNGSLQLQQLLNSYDGSVDRCKLFNARELDKATDHFNLNRILGQGGQGTVYKGMLDDGRIIAVKRSEVVDEEKLEEFVNELVILSQINHRNVVKLLGCCLETEVPFLVYEFISNGTLFQYIHNRDDQLPLTWEMRLRIATEVAGAVSYLHSAAVIPIYHRDIKSTNILLDDKCRAKVGDFGISKFVAIDQTHVSTAVLGTLGYLDPEYYQSSQLTDKSDVYSFGVVLVELLTGEKPIFSLASQENINLAKYFIYAMKKNLLHDILDGQVKQTGKKKEITAFANLAKRCLNIKGKERPTMKEVATELEGIPVLKKKKGISNQIIKYFQ